MTHRVERPPRDDDRARGRRQFVDDLLDRHDRRLGRQQRFFLHAEQAPDLHVAVAVGALRVDDGDIGIERRDRGQLLIGERARIGLIVAVCVGRSVPT